MSDDHDEDSGPETPVSGTVQRRSIRPVSSEHRLPSGQIARDPKDYNAPPEDPSPAADTPDVLDTEDISGDEPVEPAPTPAAHEDQSQGVAPVAGRPVPAEDRPRIPRWAWFAGGGILAVGLGVALVMVLTGGEEEPQAAPAPTLSESPSPTITTTAAPPVAMGLLDDGIADDEYPATATDRGEQYPSAYVMEEWVWDYVGPGWTLSALDGSTHESFETERGIARSVMYLVSPEGATFELFALPEGYEAPRVVSWHEDDRTARVVSGWGTEGALIDLTNGVPDPISFTMSEGTSEGLTFVGATESNAELWVARGNDWTEIRTYTWTPDEGWDRVMHEGDYLLASGAPDGSAALFEIHPVTSSKYASSRSGEPGRPNFVLFDLETMTEAVVEPDYPSWAEQCYNYGWYATLPAVSCYDYDTRDAAYLLSVNGDLTAVDDSDEQSIDDLGALEEYVDEASGLMFTSERGTSAVYDMRLPTEEGELVIARAGEQWPLSGVEPSAITPGAEGLYRIESYGQGVYLVDVVAGTMATISPEAEPYSGGPYARTHVYFGEPSVQQDYWYD